MSIELGDNGSKLSSGSHIYTTSYQTPGFHKLCTRQKQPSDQIYHLIDQHFNTPVYWTTFQMIYFS